MIHVTVSARFGVKGKSSGRLRSENWIFAKTMPMPPSALAYRLVQRFFEFCMNADPDMTTEQINVEIAKLREGLSTVKVEEYRAEEPGEEATTVIYNAVL